MAKKTKKIGLIGSEVSIARLLKQNSFFMKRYDIEEIQLKKGEGSSDTELKEALATIETLKANAEEFRKGYDTTNLLNTELEIENAKLTARCKELEENAFSLETKMKDIQVAYHNWVSEMKETGETIIELKTLNPELQKYLDQLNTEE